MGQNLFGANISGQLAAALGPLLKSVVLIVPGASTGVDVNDPLAGPARAAAKRWPCRGFRDDKRLSLFPSKTVQTKDAAISILGDTISGGKVEPEANHRIVFGGKELTVIAVKVDPDDALYVCQCRGA